LKELGINVKSLEQLERMAHASMRIAASHPTRVDNKFVLKAATSVLMNNTLARHTARTSFVQRVLLQRLGIDTVSAREVREMLVGKNAIPMVEHAKPELVHWLA